ncbi:MAG: aminotransferase class I/II-fold pyridoxal phosphate-dependent enzyme [Longimicrobiales bacterium]
MDRRGFVTSGMAAGLAGFSGAGGVLGPLLDGTSPGLPHSWGTRGPLPDGSIKLSSNENPLGLSPAARRAVVEAIDHANRYPHDYRGALYDALARYLRVDRNTLVLGAGSTEVLQASVQAFTGPGVPLVVAEPTFEDVPRYQRPFPYEMVTVPLDRRLAHDVGRMREAAEAGGRPAVVYFCNPNNPTGTPTPADEIDAWIADAPDTTVFLMDEAYFEYADDPAYRSALPWIQRKRNVVVVRTFSKIFGMAGLRLGYGVAHPDTAARLQEFIVQNNPNVLANAAALASLADHELVPRSVGVNDEAKAIAAATLDELGLEYLPTQANFLMHRINGDLRQYIGRMAEAGVRVGRPFPPMLEWNRLSFGLPDEMDRWAATLKDFRGKGWV